MDIGELQLRLPTVTEINEQLVEFTKEYVKQKVSEIITEISADENLPRDKLMLYIRRINFDDISSTVSSVKRPRKKVESRNRCRALTSKRDRCTRKRKDGLLYCGSHESSRPNGDIADSDDNDDTDDDSLSSRDDATTLVVRSKPTIKVKAKTKEQDDEP